jgi:hypothetical protein
MPRLNTQLAASYARPSEKSSSALATWIASVFGDTVSKVNNQTMEGMSMIEERGRPIR